MCDEPFSDFLNPNYFTLQGFIMDRCVVYYLDIIKDAPKMKMKYQLDLLKFIDHHTRALNSTSSNAPEYLEKAHPIMGWFPKDVIKCNFAATEKLTRRFLYGLIK